MLVQRAYKTELDLNNLRLQPVGSMPARLGGPTTGDSGSSRNATRKQEGSNGYRVAPRIECPKKTAVPWMYLVSKCSPQEALWNLDAAFQSSSAGVLSRNRGSGKASSGILVSRPRRGGWVASESTGRIVVSEKAIVLPRLGRLRLKERSICLPGDKDPVSHGERAGWALVCEFEVEEELSVPEKTGPVVGIDLGDQESRYPL